MNELPKYVASRIPAPGRPRLGQLDPAARRRRHRRWPSASGAARRRPPGHRQPDLGLPAHQRRAGRRVPPDDRAGPARRRQAPVPRRRHGPHARAGLDLFRQHGRPGLHLPSRRPLSDDPQRGTSPAVRQNLTSSNDAAWHLAVALMTPSDLLTIWERRWGDLDEPWKQNFLTSRLALDIVRFPVDDVTPAVHANRPLEAVLAVLRPSPSKSSQSASMASCAHARSAWVDRHQGGTRRRSDRGMFIHHRLVTSAEGTDQTTRRRRADRV